MGGTTKGLNIWIVTTTSLKPLTGGNISKDFDVTVWSVKVDLRQEVADLFFLITLTVHRRTIPN